MISRQTTTVAVLRQVLGLSVEEFGQIIGKSISTVTKLENGLLKLSEETGFQIYQETGVEFEWLMAGDPTKKPYSIDEGWNRKEPYTKELFEKIQAHKKTGGKRYRIGRRARRLTSAIALTGDWLSVYNAAAEAGRAELASYLMRQFLDGLVKRLGKDDEAFLRLNAGARIIDADKVESIFTGAEDGHGVTLQEVVLPKAA
jgi:transcriptional regulator with XRE-family HTH domain